jgi:hypothetical protein
VIKVIKVFLAVAGLLIAFPAVGSATPGQCWNSPFGGFCDQLPAQDGSFMHCEHVGYGSSLYQNCFQSCISPAGQLVPTDYDINTPC